MFKKEKVISFGIKADGSENFPKGFREFRTAINNLLSKDTEK